MNTNCTFADVKDGAIIHVELHAWLQLLPRHRRCVDCGKEEIKTPHGAWIDSACGKREGRNAR